MGNQGLECFSQFIQLDLAYDTGKSKTYSLYCPSRHLIETAMGFCLPSFKRPPVFKHSGHSN